MIMASFMEKMQVNSAITDNTKLDLGHQHITSLDFMELQPSMTKEMVPGERLDVKMESFARLNPLPVPTFGRASMRHRAFFVPYRTVFRGWNDFITDAVHVPSDTTASSALISTVPTVDNQALCNAFLSHSYGTNIHLPYEGAAFDKDAYEAAMASDSFVFGVYTNGQTIPPHDIDAAATGGGSSYYNFTTRGRQAIKVLESLGYKVIWNTMKSGDEGFINPVYSALPLLALAKVWTDWYFPNQYTNAAIYDYLVSICNSDSSSTPLQLNYNDVYYVLGTCAYVNYDADMFTAAWDSPNQPTSGTVSNFRLVNIDTARIIGFNGSAGNFSNQSSGIDVNGVVTNGANSSYQHGGVYSADAPFIAPFTPRQGSSEKATVTPISQYLLTGLKAMTDYLKRHQISGAKSCDRYLSRFGKALSAEKLNRSVYLGAAMQEVQIGDVMSTADTDGANLGGYAGKGLSYGNGQFDYSTDEYGLFIVLTSLVPAVGYFQGIDRNVKHISKLDFWTPEFDSLGSQAIAADELYVPEHYSVNYAGLDQQAFGYLPTYYEYKVKNDKVTGTFRLDSINGSNPLTEPEFNAANSWYLMRVFDNQDYANSSSIVHSPDFVFGYGDKSQYKRIFYNVDASAPDNFTVIHNFEIASFAPMKSLFDSYEFEDKGKKITEDVNGVKMN